jgi:hypothetical protein
LMELAYILALEARFYRFDSCIRYQTEGRKAGVLIGFENRDEEQFS